MLEQIGVVSDYSQHVLVDAPLGSELQGNCSNDEVDAHLLAALRHRFKLPLDIPKPQAKSGLGKKKVDSGGAGRYTTYKSIIALCQRFDVVAQQYILTALFERGMMVPYLIMDNPEQPMNMAAPLWFTKHREVNIAEDTSLMRILVIGQQKSQTIKLLLKEVFKLDSLIEMDMKFGACDVGIGLIYAAVKSDKTKTAIAMQRKVMVFFALNFETENIANLVREGLDLIIYEMPECDEEVYRELKAKWSGDVNVIFVHHEVEDVAEVDADGGKVFATNNYRGVVDEILQITDLQKSKSKIRDATPPNPEIDLLLQKMIQAGNPLVERAKYVTQKDLQECFRVERAAVQCINKDNQNERFEEIARIARNVRNRTYQASCPFLNIFIWILKNPDARNRCLLFLTFQRQLEELNARYFEHKHPEYKALLNKGDKNDIEKSKLDNMFADEAKTILGVEHLWREIASLFHFHGNSNGTQQFARVAEFPGLAATHLLDGFTMEFIDGETSQICMEWVANVMQQVKVKIGVSFDASASTVAASTVTSASALKEPRLFILSVIGVESSGKSTLLNTMFGCRLRTSLLRCTKGINMQLVRCHDRSADYMLLLDVEGVRSSKLSHIADRYLHDNRLCTMAMFIADSTIVITSGNQMSDMASVLSMVRKAAKDTRMEWKDPYFVERGINESLNPDADSRELAAHVFEKKSILQKERVYPSFDFKFEMTALPSNTDEVNASKYGVKVKQLRESMIDKVTTFSQLQEQVQTVRSNLLTVEKIFNHESNADQMRANEEENAFHTWRVKIDDVYKDCMGLIQANLFDLVAIVSKALETNDVRGKYNGNPNDPRWKSELTNSISRTSPELVNFVPIILQVICIIATRRNFVRGPLSIENRDETINVLETFLRCSTTDKLRDLCQRFDDNETFKNSPRKATYLQRKTTMLDNSEATAKQNIAHMVTARLHLNKMCEDAVAQLVRMINDLSEDLKRKNIKLPRKDWRPKFHEMVSTIKNELMRKYPTTNVNPTIEQFFNEQRVQHVPGYELGMDRNQNTVWTMFTKLFSRSRRSMDDLVLLYNTLRIDLAGLHAKVSSKMFLLDDTIKQYGEACHKLHEFDLDHENAPLTNQERNYLLCLVMDKVKEYQTACHKLWEKSNHPVERFKTYEEELWKTFQMILEGKDAMEIAVSSVSTRINNNLASATAKAWIALAFKHITKDVTDPSLNIYLNSDMFQAKTDLMLTDHMDNDPQLKEWLTDSTKLYDDALNLCLRETLCRNSLPNTHGYVIGALDDALKSVLDHIAEDNRKEKARQEASLKDCKESSSAPTTKSIGCLGVFFKSFNAVLSKKNIDIDFPVSEALSLFKPLDEVVWTAEPMPFTELVRIVKSKLTTPTARNIDISHCIQELKAMLCNDKTVSDFRLRCSECCPRCKIQCDHPGGRGHPGLHQSYHQPTGLAGVSYVQSHLIACYSCIGAALENHSIYFAEDNKVPYREFNKAFPKWSDLQYNSEVRSMPLRVREYLFYHKQDLLLSIYDDVKPNPTELETVNYKVHDIVKLKAELRSKIDKNKA